METITIRYRLTEAAQRAAILEDQNARRDREAEIETTPERLAVAQIAPDGKATIGERVPKPGNAWGWIEVDEFDADPGEALDARLAEVAADKARARVATDAARAAFLGKLAVSLAYVAGPGADDRRRGYEPIGGEGGVSVGSGSDVLATREVLDSLSTDERQQLGIVRAWLRLVAQRERDDDNARAAQDAAQEARNQAQKEETDRLFASVRDAWIVQHGSERLKKCRALGIADRCQGVYLTERLALEAPGFVWDGEGDDAYKESVIRNPSVDALAALELARATWSDAALVKIRVPDYQGGTDWAWLEAVRIDAPEDLPWAPTGGNAYRIAYRVVQA